MKKIAARLAAVLAAAAVLALTLTCRTWNKLPLDITLGADFIQLDEIEGMGAVALVVR